MKDFLIALWAFANSPLGLAIAAAAVAFALGWIRKRKPEWEPWTGTIIEAIKAVEKNTPLSTPGADKARLALAYVRRVFEDAQKRPATPEEERTLTQGISIVHADLEAAGNLDKPSAMTPHASLLLFGLLGLATMCGGCISDITGAHHEVAFCDPTTGKEIGVWRHNGDSAKMKGVTLHIDKDKYFRVGSMETTDEVAANQTQAFFAQQQTVTNLTGMLMNTALSAMGKAPIAVGTSANYQFLPSGAIAGSSGLDIQELLANCENDADRLVVLKLLTPKAKAKKVTITTQPVK